MTRTIRIALFALLVLFLGGLTGCAAPQPHQGGSGTIGYGYQSAGFQLPPERPIPAGWANEYTPSDTIHNGRCYRNGFIQSNLDACRGMAATSSQYGFAPQGQVSGTARLAGAQAPAITGMSPETARMLLDEFARRDNPCTAKERTRNVSIDALIGAVAAAVITRDPGGAAVGALIGAAGGNGEAVMSCQAYTDVRMSLLAVLDQYGCSGQVRKTNGIVTDDEVCNFRRPYTPGHAAPQIADRDARPVAAPAPTAVAPRPITPKKPGRPSWLEEGEELPPK